nr:hypothetical protein GCM10020092_011800 [Actinoplanes digitatis]
MVSGTRKRTLLSAGHATKTFLDKKKQHVPVAEPSMFVGWRRELRQTLQALRAGERAGVLLHGQGRLGKSSLAARIADRFTDRAVAVVFGDYSALGVLDAIAVAVQTNPAARELIEQGLSAVRQRPEALESVLVDLLSGPCAQTADGQRPLLLIVDDLEQILEPDPAGLHRVAAGVAPVLAAVLRAFSPDVTDSRLVVTSRFRFTLDGLQDRLEAVQLEPLSAVAQRKLARRQQARTTDQLREERQQLAERAVAVSRGNPGLQDLIGGRLVYSQAVDAARAETAVAGMEAYLDRGWLPSDTEVREFLENLALDTLIDQAGPAHTALLRQLTVFDLPVPDAVAEVLATRTGGSAERLCGLGLADVFPDGYQPDRLSSRGERIDRRQAHPTDRRRKGRDRCRGGGAVAHRVGRVGAPQRSGSAVGVAAHPSRSARRPADRGRLLRRRGGASPADRVGDRRGQARLGGCRAARPPRDARAGGAASRGRHRRRYQR